MRMLFTSLGVVLALAIAGAAEAVDCCVAPAACVPAVEACDPGCHGVACPVNCGRPDCRVVVEIKKVKKHVWVVECEEHCPALPGSRLLGGCRGSCGAGHACAQPAACGTSCGKCDACAAVRAQAQAQCPPRCTHARCRKVLKKKEIECEVPVYKCVPASRACAAGAGCCGVGGHPADAAAMQQEPMRVAPLPPVVGTSYLK
ncbi:MAG: hypothetical protein RBS80_28145 [Thermoguttaceae bacterium]|nr:hypothetical protein [Thermoguttaceae bacterium]